MEIKKMTKNKATNITWHQSALSKQEREQLLKQKGVVIWFTGLSGSGKSTLALAVEDVLYKRGHLLLFIVLYAFHVPDRLKVRRVIIYYALFVSGLLAGSVKG